MFCDFRPHPTNPDNVIVSVPCCECRNIHTFNIHEDEWVSGLEGLAKGATMLAAFPNLQPHHREALISCLCPWCFDATYPD